MPFASNNSPSVSAPSTPPKGHGVRVRLRHDDRGSDAESPPVVRHPLPENPSSFTLLRGPAVQFPRLSDDVRALAEKIYSQLVASRPTDGGMTLFPRGESTAATAVGIAQKAFDSKRDLTPRELGPSGHVLSDIVVKTVDWSASAICIADQDRVVAHVRNLLDAWYASVISSSS